jgi:hypothetical protein
MDHISTTEDAVEEVSFREAILPPDLQELRQKLGRKAKQQKRYRFYSLYALVCRSSVLQAAWAAVRRNEGAPGVDGVSIEQIGATPESEAAFLSEVCMLTWNDWACKHCESILEETTLARAGWGKSPCPVRRGRGERRSLVCGPFIPCFPSLLYWLY